MQAGHLRWTTLVVAICLTQGSTRGALGKSLDQGIPGLFGGTFSTNLNQNGQDAQRPLVADRFRGLSAALAAARSQVPIPSASGAFRFVFDDDLDSYVRIAQSLGPSIAERAQTMGARTVTVNIGYTHIDFDTLEGDSLDDLRSVQPALSEGFLAGLPESDRMHAQDDQLQTRARFSFGYDLIFLTAAYGLTDDIDISLALSVNRAHMSVAADAVIVDPNGDGGAKFTVDQVGVIPGSSDPQCAVYTCATDSFSGDAFGTGDVYLRAKWHLIDTTYADLAWASVLTVPTGNADDFLGFRDPTFTPLLIASKTFGRVSPHINLGYAFRSGADVSQAQWIAGADVMATRWLTLAGEFLGYHDDKRDGINDDVLQSAVGMKVNPFGQFVFAGTLQFPLNRDGLRADVIYSGQIEYAY